MDGGGGVKRGSPPTPLSPVDKGAFSFLQPPSSKGQQVRGMDFFFTPRWVVGCWGSCRGDKRGLSEGKRNVWRKVPAMTEEELLRVRLGFMQMLQNTGSVYAMRASWKFLCFVYRSCNHTVSFGSHFIGKL